MNLKKIILFGEYGIVISLAGCKLECHAATEDIQAVDKGSCFSSYSNQHHVVSQRSEMQLDLRVHTTDLMKGIEGLNNGRWRIVVKKKAKHRRI